MIRVVLLNGQNVKYQHGIKIEIKKMIKPLNGRVLVKLLEHKKVTESGVALPEQYLKRNNLVTIVSIDDDGRLTELREGDTVIISRSAGDDLEYNEEKFLIVNKTDILAKIRQDE